MMEAAQQSDQAMSVTSEQIIRLFSTLLGRQPESQHVVRHFQRLGSAENVIDAIVGSPEFAARVTQSPFYYYASTFDAEGIIRRNAAAAAAPSPGLLTNFLGVRINPKFLPLVLPGLEGVVEPVPIPANWHADIAEWAAVLRSVELARESFTVAELGCGWGCWLSNAGVAARRLGLDVHLVGVEGDRGHVQFARESTADNGFTAEQVTIHHGIAASSEGIALFPRQDAAGEQYDLKPIFGATEEERKAALASGRFDALPMVPLATLAGERNRLDLLHIDIQGGEADIVDGAIDVLGEKVAYMVIGTHSRHIEGRLMATLLQAGWRLEVERTAIVQLNADGPMVMVDGVQGWRNMTLLPE